jgi:DNA-binding Lrp family transcriptional regulator
LGMPSGLKIEKIAPIKVQLSESTIVSVLTTDEIRELAGYKPLEKPLEKKTEQVFSEEDDFKFDLSEFGYAEDELEVISEKELDYNPFDFADIGSIDSQVIDIIKATPKVTVEEIGQQVGETPSEVQERIDRLVNNGLLDLQKTKIKVTEEGERETSELITVYKYKLRHDAPSLRGGRSRDFCRKLMKENRSYELKDIMAMNNKQGSNVFAHRGGWYNNPVTKTRTNYCRHVWSARTVRLKKDA